MVNLNFKTQLPDNVPNRLPSYSFKRPKTNKKIILEKASIMKIQPPSRIDRFSSYQPEFRYVDNWTIYKQGNNSLALNRRSEALRFRNEVRHGRERDNEFTINENKLDKISREYINEIKLVEDPVDTLKKVKVTYLKEQGASFNGNVTQEQILDAGVVYQREIESLPVVGAGGYSMINIAHDETVVASCRIWRKKEKKETSQKIISPDVAQKTLEKLLDTKKIDNAIIHKAEFCYWEAGDNDYQRYIDPCYAFLYEIQIGQFPYKSVEVIPAVAQPKQKWRMIKRYRAPTVNRG